MLHRARASYHFLKVNKPGQIKRAQIRLPWNAIRILAVDYDVRLISAAGSGSGGSPDGTGTPPSSPPRGESGAGGLPPTERPVIQPIGFNWESAPIPTLGQLRLQSMEKARLFYNEWIKASRWDNGFQSDGVFPYQIQSRLEKPRPLMVDVPKSTTIIRVLYEDQFLRTGGLYPEYILNIVLWVETDQAAKGVNYECLTHINPEP